MIRQMHRSEAALRFYTLEDADSPCPFLSSSTSVSRSSKENLKADDPGVRPERFLHNVQHGSAHFRRGDMKANNSGVNCHLENKNAE